MAIDLTLLSPQQLDQFLHLQSLVARQKNAQARVRALRDYYDGIHPVLLTDRQEEFIGKMLTEGEFEFAHNTVKSIVDTLRERLSVTGFAVNGAGLSDDQDGAPTPDMQISALLWEWWEANRLDAQQIRLHRRALRDGLSYVMVDYDAENQRPRITLHQVDDGTTGITCHRDPENPERILFLNKYFYTYNPLEPGKTGIERKTTYLPGEVRKYIRGKDAGTWSRMDGIQSPLEVGDTVWPLPWRDAQGQPLGIPIIEFENPGGSEVAQIIGLQNALNKSWLDLIAAADAAGFPILAAEYDSDPSFAGDLNATDDDDIDGEDEFIVAPGRMLTITGGQYKRIEGANLSQLIDTIHLLIETIAGISRTPQYYLRPMGGSDVPSGEALKQLESGLIKRAVERQLIFGQAWADVMTMAYKVQRAFGPAIPDIKRLAVQTLWSNPETRNEKSDAERAEILQRLNVPEDEIWTLLGYTPEQIAKFKAMKRSDQAATTAAVVGAIQKAQAQPSATRATAANDNGGQRA